MNCSKKKIPQIDGNDAKCHQLDSTNIDSLDYCKNYVANYTEGKNPGWYICRKSKDKCGKQGLGLTRPLNGWFKQSKKCSTSTIPTTNFEITPSRELHTQPRINSARPRRYRTLSNVSSIEKSIPEPRLRPKITLPSDSTPRSRSRSRSRSSSSLRKTQKIIPIKKSRLSSIKEENSSNNSPQDSPQDSPQKRNSQPRELTRGEKAKLALDALNQYDQYIKGGRSKKSKRSKKRKSKKSKRSKKRKSRRD